MQLQLEKEKQTYDFENLQALVDKAQGTTNRLQKEREAAQLEADRFRDKNEKAQVCRPWARRACSPSSPLDWCLQALVVRTQKEKEMVQAEFVKLQERCDAMQGQLGKTLRDRETATAELDIARERLEKTQQQLQKLQVIHRHFLHEN